jgi:hypothetical protein
MSTFTLLLVDPYLNAVVAHEYVQAEDRGQALRMRPQEWRRSETRVRSGLLSR